MTLDIEARLAEIEQRNNYHHYAPLTDAIPDHVAWAQSPENRIYFGIPELDRALRGTAPGELTMIVGFAQSAKTLLVTNLLLKHPHKYIVYFSPDETRELVLLKLACAQHGVGAEQLEQMLQDPEQAGYAEHILNDTAEMFSRLAVFEDVSTLEGMDAALAEAVDALGHPIELVIFDYLDLLEGEGEDANPRATAIKAWGKRHRLPLYVIHQSSRTQGADGKKVTLTSATHGGEKQSMHMIGVRRKMMEYAADIIDLEAKIKSKGTKLQPDDPLIRALDDARYMFNLHQHTITISTVKNKRPPGRLVAEIDYELDTATGRLSPLAPGELPRGFRDAQRQVYKERVVERLPQGEQLTWGDDD
jgi:KaiC/GvpD/RAD55 family RecA-like ATPase